MSGGSAKPLATGPQNSGQMSRVESGLWRYLEQSRLTEIEPSIASVPLSSTDSGAWAQVRPPSLPRARGRAAIAVKCRDRRTVLDRLHQAGSSKILLPRVRGVGLLGVLLNTAGGIAGDDSFEFAGESGPETELTLTTQAAERVYRARPGEMSQLSVSLTAAVGSKIEWLPQETILFEGARLTRRIDIELAQDSAFLAVEPIILGRPAMGERTRDIVLRDQWRVRRAGRLIYADAMRVCGDAEEAGAGPATLAGARAFVSLVLIAADAEQRLKRLREVLPPNAGATCLATDILCIRLVAASGFQLRRDLIPMLLFLRDGPPPSIWTI